MGYVGVSQTYSVRNQVAKLGNNEYVVAVSGVKMEIDIITTNKFELKK